MALGCVSEPPLSFIGNENDAFSFMLLFFPTTVILVVLLIEDIIPCFLRVLVVINCVVGLESGVSEHCVPHGSVLIGFALYRISYS